MIPAVKRWKRMFYYLLINVVVSACTIVTILFLWERLRAPISLAPIPAGSAEIQGDPVTPSTTAQGPVEPAATVALQRYQVQAGDTLAAIAAVYGITVEEILAVNEIDNPNVLRVGQVLTIPLPDESQPVGPAGAGAGGEPTGIPDTPTPPVLAELPTTTPLPEGFEIDIQIVTVVAPGDLESERVVILLNSDGELGLRDWRLEDEDGNLFLFPDLKLFKGGAVNVYTKAGGNSVVELFWGQASPVWEQGEVATLTDAQGEEWASYEIP